MKKILMLSAAAFVLSPAAFAEDAPPAPKAGGPGHHGMMGDLDTDKDGAISKAEFLAFHEKRFAEMDTNSDGKITKEESDAKRAKWKEKFKDKRKVKEGAAPVEAPAESPAEAPAETPAE